MPFSRPGGFTGSLAFFRSYFRFGFRIRWDGSFEMNKLVHFPSRHVLLSRCLKVENRVRMCQSLKQLEPGLRHPEYIGGSSRRGKRRFNSRLHDPILHRCCLDFYGLWQCKDPIFNRPKTLQKETRPGLSRRTGCDPSSSRGPQEPQTSTHSLLHRIHSTKDDTAQRKLVRLSDCSGVLRCCMAPKPLATV